MKTLIGGLMLAAGILIAGASGLCSLVIIVMGIGSINEPGELMSGLLMVTLVGGIPFLLGLGLFIGGRALIRSDRTEDD
jgi:hypothetical protein